MKSLWCLMVALLVSGSLAGCQNAFRNPSVTKTTQAPPVQITTAPAPEQPMVPEQPLITADTNKMDLNTPEKNRETVNLERCKAQLDALKTLAPKKYPKLNNAFRYIMRGAASYASIRSETTPETQDTIDALYHYRSNLICAQINQTMMNSLSLHGALP